MEVCRRSSWLLLLLGVSLLATTLQGVQGEVESEGPSESECRPYIEKALKELETGEAGDAGTPETDGDSKEDVPTVEITTDDSEHDSEGEHDTHEDGAESTESVEQNAEQSEQEDVQAEAEPEPSAENETEKSTEETDDTTKEDTDGSQEAEVKASAEDDDQQTEEDKGSDETAEAVDADSKEGDDTKEQESKEDGNGSQEAPGDSKEDQASEETGDAASQEKGDAASQETGETASQEAAEGSQEVAQGSQEDTEEAKESKEEPDETKEDSKEDEAKEGSKEDDTKEDSKEDVAKDESKEDETKEDSKEDEVKEDSKEEDTTKEESKEDDTKEGSKEEEKDDTEENDTKEVKDESKEETKEDSKEDEIKSAEEQSAEQQDITPDEASPAAESKEDETAAAEDSKESAEEQPQADDASAGDSKESTEGDGESKEGGSDEQPSPEEELSLDIEIPTDLRERDHVEHLLKIDDEASETENIINRIAEITLRELKKLYENAIKPLEGLYKYRDLSNRHFGDSEIFSKPLILFMGPWSGGKSSIINYLLDNEYNETSLRTGAEPSPAYFNILMYGEEPEIIDGTQLAADFTFSGLQKFGQGLEERLRGVKLPNKLLEKVNIVEIPGILEVRKQVSRVFPFNDACQWFIDRADIIFLVYDPSKLDVGPETEAILDQLKGREHQTRIILNKADQVKPEELMRVQGALIWNISPLMSSAQPPVMYTTSLWSRPYEVWAPTRLLQAQERAFLRDLRTAIDKRIENKIASARRFAVRVRNHAKMVDCYLTTYYNHKSVFGNRKQVAEQIIEHPQDYHIYEGLSTLTNISRYDLPDPDVYKDFFKLNPLYEFQQLSATCTYFRGCPINRLDVAIAYDLPELVGKHKRLVESALGEATQANQAQVPGS